MTDVSCLKQLTGSSPDELVSLLKEIKTPIKIIGMTNYGVRQVAYVIVEQEKTAPEIKKTKSKER